MFRLETYQTEVDFHCRRNENRPAEPGCIVADDHALPDVYGADGTGNVDDDSQTKDGDDRQTLASRQFEAPNQWHGQCRHEKVSEDIDDTRSEDNGSVIQTFVWVCRADIPISLYGTVYKD